MADQNFPILDGLAPSWADVTVKADIDGGSLITIDDIASINTGTTVTEGRKKGATGGRVRKRTRGSQEDTASMSVYLEGYTQLVAKLAKLAPQRGKQRRISLVTFTLEYMYSLPDDAAIFHTQARGCRVLGRDLNDSEGEEATKVDVALSVMEVVDIVGGDEIVML